MDTFTIARNRKDLLIRENSGFFLTHKECMGEENSAKGPDAGLAA